MEWHGYPQHPDAAEHRPWWRLTEFRGVPYGPRWGAERTDGRRVLGATSDLISTLDRIDREHPLPCPPLRCQQVWVAPERDGAGGGHRTIVSVDPDGAVYTVGYSGVKRHAAGEWPRPGNVLVAGPGAPWADTREEP